jgi:hypothetical protein
MNCEILFKQARSIVKCILGLLGVVLLSVIVALIVSLIGLDAASIYVGGAILLYGMAAVVFKCASNQSIP